MQAKLHEYQKYSVDWILEHPYCGLLLDMGLGKSLTTLTAIELLQSLIELDGKTLIIAPLSVAENTWPEELAKWDHLKGLTYSLVIGPKKAREASLDLDRDIYITNRENVVWLAEFYKKRWPFKTVIIDELSSFKSPSAKRFRALKRVRPLMDRVIGLTGTPAPNSLMDLWPQIYLLDQGERLGRTITEYRHRYFHPGQTNGHVVYNWILNDGAEEKIYKAISDICISMKSKDYLELPPRTNNIVNVYLNKAERKTYDKLEHDLVLDIDEQEVTAASAAVLGNKLLQLANGAIYDDEHEVVKIHDRKLDALESIIDDAQGQSVLVFYNYKHDLERLMERFPEARVLDPASNDVKDWNAGKIKMLLAHPQSAGHGLNLQQGGHIIVWFSMIWSLEFYQQANARLDRQGQKEPVIVHHLVAKDTVDERALEVLQGKEKTQDALMAAVRASIKGHA